MIIIERLFIILISNLSNQKSFLTFFFNGFLFGLGAGGQAGVEQVLKRMRDELRRDMILLGCKTIKELNKSKIAYR